MHLTISRIGNSRLGPGTGQNGVQQQTIAGRSRLQWDDTRKEKGTWKDTGYGAHSTDPINAFCELIGIFMESDIY